MSAYFTNWSLLPAQNNYNRVMHLRTVIIHNYRSLLLKFEVGAVITSELRQTDDHIPCVNMTIS